MQGESPVQGGPRSSDHSGDANAISFGAQLIVHLLYDDERSAAVAGHKHHGYATTKVTHPEWFKSKDAFMGLVCKAFERFYDEMMLHGPDDSKSESVREQVGDKTP